jgi:hypothetical protein
MTKTIEEFANEAIFVLQLNTPDAVSYVKRNAGVDRKTAGLAIKNAVIFHRK